MDDLYLDGMPMGLSVMRILLITSFCSALGITEEVEKLGLKGSKKKRGKKLDEDFIVKLLADSKVDILLTFLSA